MPSGGGPPACNGPCDSALSGLQRRGGGVAGKDGKSSNATAGAGLLCWGLPAGVRDAGAGGAGSKLDQRCDGAYLRQPAAPFSAAPSSAAPAVLRPRINLSTHYAPPAPRPGQLLREAVEDLEWPGGAVEVVLQQDPPRLTMAASGHGALEVG